MRKFNQIFLIVTLLFLGFFSVNAQDKEKKGTFTVYGHAQIDAGYNAKQIHPDWFDVIRPTKLPSYKNEFGTDGNMYFSARQTRFGVQSLLPTEMGDLKVIFEMDMFGVGTEAGQTMFRLRYAYGELGQFGAGQYQSPFMDIDAAPSTLEYWGPTGIIFFRNLQFRWMPIKGKTKLSVALERPGASYDGGKYEDQVELENVNIRTPVPDLSAEYRKGADWGYVELSGILRYVEWQDQNDLDNIDLSDNMIGWGLSLSSNIKFGKNTVGKFQTVYGHGMQNYMTEGGTDIGLQNNESDPQKPVIGVALPVFSAVAFVDHNWNEKLSSTFGYSIADVKNSDGQNGDAYRQGQYALANLKFVPVKNIMAGVEFQYGKRKNFYDGWSSDLYKIQFSMRFKFSSAKMF